MFLSSILKASEGVGMAIIIELNKALYKTKRYNSGDPLRSSMSSLNYRFNAPDDHALTYNWNEAAQ